jgi:hypothetical protein
LVLSRASQAAFAVIVNAGVDLWFAFLARKHFENHSSALHARKEVTPEADLACPPFPAVNPEATVKFVAAPYSVASPKEGTELHVVFPVTKTV